MGIRRVLGQNSLSLNFKGLIRSEYEGLCLKIICLKNQRKNWIRRSLKLTLIM